MVKIGDEMTTSDGKVFKMVPRQESGSAVTLTTLANILDQVNINLSILIDTERWIGKYTSLEDTLDANAERKEYKFYFPVRYLKIYADQPISLQINDVGNPIINISAGEFPYELPHLRPGFVISSLFITTGTIETRITILALG